MAKKPDGKPASVDRVSFTRPAAERIGRAVRQVEAGVIAEAHAVVRMATERRREIEAIGEPE